MGARQVEWGELVNKCFRKFSEILPPAPSLPRAATGTQLWVELNANIRGC
jgi:hypothetical protein